GGSLGNRTSRLYRALVETELASGVGGALYPSIDPHLFSLVVTIRDGRSAGEVQAALDAAIDRIAAGDLTCAELDKAKKQAAALFAYGTEGVTGQAFWLAFSENFSSYTWYEDYLAHLRAVTLDEVCDAARRLLRRSQRTVGSFVPVRPSDHEVSDV
ncbi:MAG: insulinase family protein, partial [Anaerolineae bacterium]|nr:insulinase family protein [Anaerolineae bacterium]